MPDSVALFVIRAGEKPGVPDVRVFSLPGGSKLDERIRAFRNQIASRDIDYKTSARALYDTLIGPGASALRGSDRWVISPAGSLWDVPFQALIDPTGKHILEAHALTFAPSLSTLWQVEQRPNAKSAGTVSLLAVASPSVKGMAPIPDAEREARGIAALYPASVTLTGERARSALFRQSANTAQVIHVASHAETEASHPLESFLALSPDPGRGTQDDGTVTARDILGLKLEASLVVLSACETARGAIGKGEGVLGLGWAVLAAGARASVLSQWQVDSAATADLMIDFHRRMTAAKAQGKSEALREASLATMRMPGRQHPFYWASFIVVGDGR
jgi:CHAT domain-containing protein